MKIICSQNKIEEIQENSIVFDLIEEISFIFKKSDIKEFITSQNLKRIDIINLVLAKNRELFLDKDNVYLFNVPKESFVFLEHNPIAEYHD
jgi:hypothetical protein